MGEIVNQAIKDWAMHHKSSKQRRAGYRAQAQLLLTEHGIEFTSHNDGAHLRLVHGAGHVDYWPGTGRWVVPGARPAFGLFHLIRHIKGYDKAHRI